MALSLPRRMVITHAQRCTGSVKRSITAASSHSRAFVLEVTDRHRGWLALLAGISSGADFIFVPERRPDGQLCARLPNATVESESVIVQPIRADYIRHSDSMGMHVTQLGYTQVC
ncbi:hypothetical protein L210DRAFT_2667401 [Boletus edulis BED1]|uniref:6-phosphofructokinase n=1 Tax=Boletus edulis BED1 TaxID=1328754 RepID=A0AAD4GBP0_BOLED|nr:hypothetical protein L210DRAFT_2667401 [Boletus edulis BED1]